MMNFLFGTVAGGIIACILTITAARHPAVQARLGLIPSAQAALAVNPMAHPMANVEKQCPSAGKADDGKLADAAKLADKLFEKRRFWFVAP